MKITLLVVLLGLLSLQVLGQSPDYCFLEPVTGVCMALFRNFYYNEDTSTCESFIYGGCGGNENNFKTKEECLSTCVKSG